uniref:2-aminoethanethiol dioxygenase n=1 Tax=Eptatretus burgeri TaxID=7764 RepID=A0A8C4QRL0_EPTBU
MPTDAMAAGRLQAVARQARFTFRGSARRLSPSSTSLCTLRELLGNVCASDLRISEPTTRSTNPKGTVPPVTYMNIYDDEDFSLGVFLLKPNSTIPLHDHPGMYGFMKVLYGRLSVTNVPTSFPSFLSLVQHGSDLSFSRVFVPVNLLIRAGTALAVPDPVRARRAEGVVPRKTTLHG